MVTTNTANPNPAAGVLYPDFLRRRQWNIGVVHSPVASFLDPDFRPDVEWLPPPRSLEYLADPFGVLYEGRLHVMCERFDRRMQSGSIWMLEWPVGGGFARSTPVLRLNGHASYPYLLEEGGKVYCVPETSRAGEVGLYRADRFPFDWRRVGTLLQGFPGVDNTLFRHEDRWWLLSTTSEVPDGKLYAWYADRIEGPWSPHPENPVKQDLSSARPGGTPFVADGALYRPAQDCSKSYGARIVINKVLELTPKRFREARVRTVEPDAKGPYPLGLHTLSSVGSMTLVDGLRNRWSTWRIGRGRNGRPRAAGGSEGG